MMLQCLNWCKENNITQVELKVSANNKRAITMYKDFGFKTTGTIPKAMRFKDNSYADELLMIMEI